jgi:hypothetical protein
LKSLIAAIRSEAKVSFDEIIECDDTPWPQINVCRVGVPALNYELLVEPRRMAILAECDICGNQHRVKDGLVGTAFRCKDCGVQIVVPDGHHITPDAFIEENGRLRRRDPKPTTSPWGWIFVGLAASLVVVALSASVWMFAELFRSIPMPAKLEPKCLPASTSCE